MVTLFSALVLSVVAIKKLRIRKFAVFVGEGPFFALFGFFLRRLTLVDRVVFYIQDWYPPQRKAPFPALLLAAIVTKAEELGITRADCIWANNQRLIDAHSLNIHRRKTSQCVETPTVVPV